MTKRLLLVLVLLLTVRLNGQWQEQMMYLPDSFSGCSLITGIFWNWVNDRVYFPDAGAHRTVVTIDCRTDEKIPPIRFDNGLGFGNYNSVNNYFYGVTPFVASVCTLCAISCENRQVVARIPIFFQVSYQTSATIVYNSVTNKVYLIVNDELSTNDSLFVIDANLNQITDRKGVNLDYYDPDPIFNPRHNVTYIFCTNKVYVFDGYTETIVDTIVVFSNSSNLGFGLLDTLNERLYFWGCEYLGQHIEPKILIIDCSTNQVLFRIALDSITQSGVDMDIDPINQKLFVSPILGDGKTIWVIDPDQGIIADSICTEFCLLGLKYNIVNNMLYVPTNGRSYWGWRDTILIINPVNHQIAGYIDLTGFYEINMTGRGCVWFLHPVRNKLYIPVCGPYLLIVDCQTNQIVKELVLGVFQPKGFLWTPITNRFYCPDISAPFVHCFDAATNQALYSIKLPIPGYGLYKLALSTQQNKIYIGFPDGIVVLDGTVDTVIKVIWFEPGVRNLCYNPTSDKIYGSSVPYTCVINCANDEIISVINTEWASLSFCNPRTNKVYVTSNYVTYIIDGAGDTLLATLDLIGGSIAFREIGELVYISHEWVLNNLVIVDGRTNQILEYLPNLPYNVIYNPINDQLYCGSLVLDCATNMIVDTLPVVFYEAIHNPINNKLYSYDSSSVVVIDCVTNEIIARFAGLRNHLRTPTWNSIQNRTYIYLDQESRVAIIRDEIPGIEENKTLNATRFTLEVYPNPAKSFLAIRLPSTADDLTLKIFDVSGKMIKVADMVKRAQEHKQEVRISLKGINPGIYFLRLGKETKKFLVVK